jgi:hypothetical protein
LLPEGGVEGVVPVPLDVVVVVPVEPVPVEPVLVEPVPVEPVPVVVEPVDPVDFVPVPVEPLVVVEPVPEELEVEVPDPVGVGVVGFEAVGGGVVGFGLVVVPVPVDVVPVDVVPVLDEPVLEVPVELLELPVDPVDVPLLEVPGLTVGLLGVMAVGAAPWPSVRLSSTLICESTVMLSDREPALIISALTDDVLNVALAPSTVATIELPLFAKSTAMVLVSPVVPVQVSTPPTRVGVTESMSRASSSSMPLNGKAGIFERLRRFFDVRLPPPGAEICLDAETRTLRVRFDRAIILPLPEKSELETREPRISPIRLPKQLRLSKYWNALLIASPKTPKNKKFFARAKSIFAR